ncbi:MAG: gliding motility-associated C-terminal domain-containing protein [Bacteroidota bacterium]
MCFFGFASGLCAQADTLSISAPEALVEPGEMAEIYLEVDGFDSLVSVQFSINWDANVIQYLSHQEADLSSIAIGESDADDGNLRFSWFSPEGTAISLPDDSRIIVLQFLAIGEQGDSSPVEISGNPLDIQVFRDGGDSTFIFVETALDPGIVRIGQDFAVDIEFTEPICRGDSGSINYQTDADPALYTIGWFNADGQPIPDEALSALPAGVYELRITDASGNIVFSTTQSITQPSLSLQLSSLQTTPSSCLGPDGAVSVEAIGGDAPYQYILGEDTTGIGSFETLGPDQYILQIVDERGCLIEATFEIEQTASPNLELGDSLRSLCGDMPVFLQAEVSEDVDFRWSNGSNEPVLLVTEPGVYILTVTNNGGCTAIDSVLVVDETSVSAELLSPLFPICPGDSILLDIGGGTDFEWLGQTAGLSTVSSRRVWARPDSSTTYTVTVFTDCAADTIALEVEILDTEATAGEDTCVVIGDEIQLMASGGLFYEWEDSTYPVDDPSSPTPFVRPLERTTYAVLIEDANGCLTRDEVVVATAENPAETILAINTITPNNDGDNDELDFGDISKFGENSLQVYSRWGRLVYNKVDYQSDDERFDGMYLGEPLPAGNYYYVLEFRTGTIRQTLLIVR